VSPRLDLSVLLTTAPADPAWEAETAGWRCFVMGNVNSGYRRSTRLHAAWQRGFDAAARSPDPERLML
jgi:hypothetical protein